MPKHCSGGRRSRSLPVRLAVLALIPLLAYTVLVVAGRSAPPGALAVSDVTRLLDRGLRISPNTAAPSVVTTATPVPSTTPGSGATSSSTVDRTGTLSDSAPKPPTRADRGARPARTASPTMTLVPPAVAGGLSTPEQEALVLSNQERERKGCPALTLDSRLTEAAREHAADMVAEHYFDHVAPDGSTPSDRAKAAGYPRGVGENIAVGYTTAAAVMEGWMGSSGHRANILNCSYTAVGIGFDPGVVRSSWGPGTWVEVFGGS